MRSDEGGWYDDTMTRFETVHQEAKAGRREDGMAWNGRRDVTRWNGSRDTRRNKWVTDEKTDTILTILL